MNRPISILVAALGGEGGGVMSDWIVAAATRADLPVQGTSIPGVAQRTGATTYYVEVARETNAVLGGKRPVMGLYPSPGEIDAMIATELMEAARACENGFVTPDRTTLIAATHRVYATAERIAMGDGRADAARLFETARAMAKRPILFDLTQDKARRELPLNAVMLGALSATGLLPIDRAHFIAAIESSGIAVKANLAGFAAGEALANTKPVAPVIASDPETDAIIAEGAQRCAAYQDGGYAGLYLARMTRVASQDAPALTREVARRLALWMTYEDIARVAQLKTTRERFAEIRAEVRVKPDQPIRVIDHFSPGFEELAAQLPRGLGERLERWATRTGRIDKRWSMRVTSSSITGFTLLRLLAVARHWRPRSLRFAREDEAIERWLTAILVAAPRDPRLAMEIAGCARLLKGYGDTYRRGRVNFTAMFDRIIDPALAAPTADAAARVKAAREAALADPDGKTLKPLLAHAG